MALHYAERPAAGEPAGLLILHHGRGSDELDMLGLGDALDPARRLHLLAPRAPLQLPGAPGWHWYVVPRVGFPDPDTFVASARALAELHDEARERIGVAPGATVLGGFSQGSVMAYASALGPGRPAPAGVLAFSGFLPAVEGWPADASAHPGLPAFVAHGRADNVIAVEFGRSARDALLAGGADVSYAENDGGHGIDRETLTAASEWLAALALSR